MAGLALVASLGRSPVDPRPLASMVAAAPHRARLGTRSHREERLAVATLVASGRDETLAPVVDPRTGVVVACDARLDRTTELAARLRLDDGERGPATLVLEAYLRWGPAAFAQVEGDLAAAIWDPRQALLVLARDVVGMRSLAYRVDGEQVVVASDVEQVLAGAGARPYDERTIAQWLVRGAPDPDRTFFDDVRSVAPNEVVLLTVGQRRIRRAWDPPTPQGRASRELAQEAGEELQRRFLAGVASRLSGRGPAAVLLSGGLDSGSAASAAGWLHERGVVTERPRTYSWDFGRHAAADERARSRLVVERYHLDGHDVPIEDAGPLARFPAGAPDRDDPVVSAFQVALDRSYARAREDGAEVLLAGILGDVATGPLDLSYHEIRASSGPVVLGRILREQALVTGERPAPLWWRWLLRPTLGELRRGRLPGGRRSAASVILDVAPHVRALARRHDVGGWTDPFAAAGPGLDPRSVRRRQLLWQPWTGVSTRANHRRLAAFGLEPVDAWSDRSVLELLLSLPPALLDRPPFDDKPMVRTALRGVLPGTFQRLATKTLPLPLYVHTLRGPSAPTVEHLLTDPLVASAGWVDQPLARARADAFLRGEADDEGVWWLLTLEWWLRVREGALPSGPVHQAWGSDDQR